MKRTNIIGIVTCTILVLLSFLIHTFFWHEAEERVLRIGFVYVYDESSAYTSNFSRCQSNLEAEYGTNIQIYTKYNVSEDETILIEALEGLIQSGCEVIYGTSYGYQDYFLNYAQMYPNIQFVMATADNYTIESPDNYHTYMGSIYEGRYVSGVVAGMKIAELIEDGTIKGNQAKVGYVAAFPYSEVISGYTAFLLGVRSVVPQAVMSVKYTDSWGDYTLEKKYAEELIQEGCVIISQHSDTIGPAAACEELAEEYTVYHVGYNRNMIDIAPTTTLTGCRINWTPYIIESVGAVLKGKKIENRVSATKIFGNDSAAGFSKGWVEMLELNSVTCPKGAKEAVERTKEKLIHGEIQVFIGNYTGTDPFDPSDTISLVDGFEENAHRSSPEFHYVLDDVITIEE